MFNLSLVFVFQLHILAHIRLFITVLNMIKMLNELNIFHKDGPLAVSIHRFIYICLVYASNVVIFFD